MKRKNIAFLLLFIFIAAVIYLTGESYYQGLESTISHEPSEQTEYQYKYDMIVDNPDSEFWQAVYKSASETAGEYNVLLELKNPGWGRIYDKEDYMNMSIAARVDGIILQYSGEKEIEEKINEAVDSGIPVVTVMGDPRYSERQSFIGVSDYQLGQEYGQVVADYVNADTKKVMVFLSRSIDDMNESQIYTQISNAVASRAAEGQEIEVDGKNLLLTGDFETEEAVTDIFQQSSIPDILVCMDEEITECARQAVIDFNKAGEVAIIGYYTSDDTLAALDKGVIAATCDIDTSQMGTYAIQALTDYQEEGRTNAFYNVDIDFIRGKENGEKEGRRQ